MWLRFVCFLTTTPRHLELHYTTVKCNERFQNAKKDAAISRRTIFRYTPTTLVRWRILVVIGFIMQIHGKRAAFVLNLNIGLRLILKSSCPRNGSETVLWEINGTQAKKQRLHC